MGQILDHDTKIRASYDNQSICTVQSDISLR